MKRNIVFLTVLIYLIFTPNWGSKKHTVYEVYCSYFESGVYDCPDKLYTSKTTYLAIPETQTIIGKSGMLWAYDDCTVFDAENWACDTLKDDGRDWNIWMTNGAFYPYNAT